ncbi:uncharacterized protein LAESUDRAFT_513519 [Laetiporus sulphureus 93-53]|uniref:Uncharacterized protein n=1 Tax=Laetiporus sulphureus 93-53 TaxID=1314785 RepID=A0A165FZF2_9APHY|nr:uncharacterized protein LAESUDRAFT_513519 [Laetiporus sulphureus 93-53]KZT09618.1 hypothetical protein LAESUDRAFT_513519 [Laetiporus sulphureus 93-53]
MLFRRNPLPLYSMIAAEALVVDSNTLVLIFSKTQIKQLTDRVRELGDDREGSKELERQRIDAVSQIKRVRTATTSMGDLLMYCDSMQSCSADGRHVIDAQCMIVGIRCDWATESPEIHLRNALIEGLDLESQQGEHQIRYYVVSRKYKQCTGLRHGSGHYHGCGDGCTL